MNFRIIFLLLMTTAHGAYSMESKPARKVIEAFLGEIFACNARHFDATGHVYFRAITERQNPRATVLMCSDSRVQCSAIDDTPVNDLFFVRNIGNQIETAEGSVDYGVRHLHTPVLLIMGHSGCGAVKAALGDFSKEPESIRRELSMLNLRSAPNCERGVVENVHHQVDVALLKFDDLIKSGELVILGLVYDFRDDFKHGHGRLVLVNLNGEKETQKLKENDHLTEIKAPIMVQRPFSIH